MTSRAATNADRIIEMLTAAGVQRLFGVPGGGSIADLIEAAGDAGLPFTLAHTETAAAFMASAQAEITGRPGACLATLGPGAASLMNGIANAHLDRVPLIAITDCLNESEGPMMRHQALCHQGMFAPVVKWSARPSVQTLDETLSCALAQVLSLPPGPVHMDISNEVTACPCGAGGLRLPTALGGAPAPIPFDHILRASHFPVFLVGLGARDAAVASALSSLSARHDVPALVTYKAKGVIPDRHPWFAGVFTNAALERPVLQRADLFIAVGLDPVELLPRPWTLPQPIVSLSASPVRPGQLPISHEFTGDLPHLLQQLAAALTPSRWDHAELRTLVEEQRRRMRPVPTGPTEALLPHRVVEIVAETYAGARISVDAGAHMFPVMAHWPAEQPAGVLISNGLSTMGFALPAAIGAALLDPSQPVVAFTGDGGLMMCTGELRTAARENLPLRIVVFQDEVLSLIKVKQEQRGYRTDGVSLGEIDWSSVAAGFGVRGLVATDENKLRAHLQRTRKHRGPVLIAAKITAETYAQTIRALRG